MKPGSLIQVNTDIKFNLYINGQRSENETIFVPRKTIGLIIEDIVENINIYRYSSTQAKETFTIMLFNNKLCYVQSEQLSSWIEHNFIVPLFTKE